jgi:hypothetical protein
VDWSEVTIAVRRLRKRPGGTLWNQLQIGLASSREVSKEFCFAAALKTEWWRVQSERAAGF